MTTYFLTLSLVCCNHPVSIRENARSKPLLTSPADRSCAPGLTVGDILGLYNDRMGFINFSGDDFFTSPIDRYNFRVYYTQSVRTEESRVFSRPNARDGYTSLITLIPVRSSACNEIFLSTQMPFSCRVIFS